MKNVEELMLKTLRGGRKYNSRLVLTNEDLKDILLTEYIEFRTYVTASNQNTVLIDPSIKQPELFNPLSASQLSSDNAEAIAVCNVLVEVSQSLNITISERELEIVKNLIVESYLNDQPHTICSLYKAVQEIDQENNANLLITINALI